MHREKYYGVNGVECKVLYNIDNSSTPVLLLHGYNFTRNTWKEIGLIDALEELKIDFVAPDMPYGRNASCSKKSRDTDLNLHAVKTVINEILLGRAPIIVGASLGGRIALYYASLNPVIGLFLASPAVKERDPLWNILRSIRTHIIIIRGSRDLIPLNIHLKLSKKLNARIIVYEGAGHAVYLYYPKRFINDLLKFYREVS